MSIKQSIDFHITDFSYFLSVLISVLNFINIQHVCLVMLIIALISLMPSVAHSHKVNIFAYAEDDKIFTESYFNDGTPCKGSMIQVYDLEGNQLLQGKTNEEGTFSFKVPKRTDLRIVLTASMGHKAEYRMPVIEPSPFSTEGKPVKIADQNNISNNSIQPDMAVDLDQVRAVVEDAVDRSIEKKMKPLMNSMIQSMVKAQTTRVAFRDIIGGIGYIFGIMGLILYFKKRDK